jgi:LmbE family N-acetylglucosaminyl deacetylase
MNHYDIIILSPHLDDAVASLGGLISKNVSLGKKVHVATYFTKEFDSSTLPKKLAKVANYKERKIEDKNSLDFLGASYEWIDLPERAMRKPWLKKLTDVFHSPSSIEGFTELTNIKNHIESLLSKYKRAIIYAPLGAGNHQDHVEVFLAAFHVMVEKDVYDRFYFYEDFYSLGNIMRKNHFLTKTRMWKRRKAPSRTSLRWTLITTVMGLSRKGQTIEDFLGKELDDVTWSVSKEKISPEQLDKKIDSFMKHTSQMEMFGGNRDKLKRLVSKYHQFWDDSEPIWNAKKRK